MSSTSALPISSFREDMLQFPSETQMISYLNKHPLLASESHKCGAGDRAWNFPARSCFTQLKIIEAVAKIFGDQVIPSKEVKLSKVITKCLEANSRSWPMHITMMHVVDLQTALENCAKNAT